MSCRKCGHYRIHGPTYDKETDSLTYQCLQCGYKWYAPTLDNKEELERYQKQALEKINKPASEHD